MVKSFAGKKEIGFDNIDHVDAIDYANASYPQHVAIIMDGNRRWAKQRRLPIIEGHRRGVEALKKTVRASVGLGIQYLTVWAFSTENWKRSKEEVNGLISLIRIVLKRELAELHENGVCLKFLGDRSRFDTDIIQLMAVAEELTKDNEKITLIIALNYGFRDDMTRTVKFLAQCVHKGQLNPEEITEKLISASLSTADYPDPDLLIRTSGEYRISNYLLWELAYTELYFTDTYWPDFNKEDLLKAVSSFSQRQRRFGGN